jgi:undecaprenyl-diphosphatase
LNRYFKASAYILVLFILIAFLVTPKLSFNIASPIIKSDSSAFLDVNTSHFQPFNKLMIWLSKYGRDLFWPIVIILLFVFGGWTGRKTASVIIISMLVLIPLAIIAKDIVSRPRPVGPKSDFLVATDKDFGFPSGEALIVSAGSAVTLALFRDTPRKLLVSLALAIEAALVCISRVYVGGHYPLDVMSGILLGVGVSFIFVGLEKHIESVMLILRKNILRR